MADVFQGGTSAGGMTRDVTGSELAEVCQQIYVRVTGCNRIADLHPGELYVLPP